MVSFSFQTMVHSVPLYFRVQATNTMGLSSTTSCQIPTYDMTLPVGRITSDFSSTSHPGIIQVSALAFDDSAIVEQMVRIMLKLYAVYPLRCFTKQCMAYRCQPALCNSHSTYITIGRPRLDYRSPLPFQCSLSSSISLYQGEVLPATFSPPHLLFFSTFLCLLYSSSSLHPLLSSSHLK